MSRRANHHYWPKSLSQYWADESGLVTRLSWNGEEVRSSPKNFGAIGDGHTVKVDGPWRHTIEGLFQRADDNFIQLVEKISILEAKQSSENDEMIFRFKGYGLSEDFRLLLGEGLVSLIVRSPNFRNKMKMMTDFYRQGLPYRDKDDWENLIVMNLKQQYGAMLNQVKRGGKYIIAFSDEKEFIFPEGFFSNISPASVGTRKCFVPITPTMAVGYCRPMSYRTLPNTVTIRLSAREVDWCNSIAQIYTKDYIYYRSDKPIIDPAFSQHEFLMFDYHTEAWMDAMLGWACNYYKRGDME